MGRRRRNRPPVEIISGYAPPGDARYQLLVGLLVHRYAKEIASGVARGLRYEFRARHDDHCPKLNGGGLCDCNVEVEIVESGNPESN